MDKAVSDSTVQGSVAIDMSQNTPTQDYAASDISELARQQRAAGKRSSDRTAQAGDQTTRVVARRLLSACIVVPAVLWWTLSIGMYVHWYQLHTCALLFVCAVTAALGGIVWFNVTKLSRLDAQRAQAQEQLKSAKEAAENANRFKTMFFANISHEIRTPLTAINGFAELLLNPQRTAEQRLADARIIRRNGEHLLTLINDILDLSKIEAGKMSVERISCGPAEILGEVCSMLRARATEKGLALDVKFDGPIPKHVRTDPTRLRQVLINLVSNAIKFTKKGGVRLNVSIQPAILCDKPLLEIKITDTGIGIPMEQQTSLFQPFVQADATITRQYGGSGLGLAISQHFARALGGDITLVSEPGCGTTFTLTVETGPLGHAEIHPHPEQAMQTQDSYAGPKVRIAGSVLVAEDGQDNQELISAKLRETGLNVEIASNGQLACEKALAFAACGKPFDLILMDVQMPVMDGFTATLNLRGKGYRGPIIALTANAMEHDRTKCLTAGCNDFVTKPIQMRVLLKAIGRYLKVVEVAQEPASAKESAGSAASRPAKVQQFYQDMPVELARMDQAIEREDRVRLKEIVQLMVGTAAAAGLKDVVPQVERLLRSIETEQSWRTLRQLVADFARNFQSQSNSQAA